MFRATSIRLVLLLSVAFIASCNSGVQQGDSNSNGNGGAEGGGATDATGVRARVRNESGSQADVTLRFLADDEISALSFVRVPPETITTISGPGASAIELSGVNERGEALDSARLIFGVDFDEARVAEYVIRDRGAPPEEPSEHPVPRLTMSPLSKGEILLGQTLTLEWTDSGSAAGAISLFLRPAGKESPLVSLGPAITVALDGLNDSLVAVVERVEPGEYEVVGRIDDGDQTVFSVAPGTLVVSIDAGNSAPTMSLVAADLQTVRNGDSLSISWTDRDADDNATITFSLVPSEPGGIGSAEFVISPPIAEDTDRRPVDSTMLTLRDVLPGLYDLVGRIDDGKLAGTSRIAGAVRVVPSTDNELPKLNLIEPARDFEVVKGGAFTVRWSDSDANDNARIWFLLDSDPQTSLLNGNEFVLAASVAEDPDGGGDQISLIVPAEVVPGVYRLVSVISDGLTQVITRATALISVRARVSSGGGSPVSGGGDTIPGDDDNDNDDDNGGGGTMTQVTLVPSAEIINHPGELITVWVTHESAAPPARRSNIYLSNEAYGGSFFLDVTPMVGPAPTTKTYSLVIDSSVIPNAAWPRSFDILVETIVDGFPQVSRSPRPIWIRQEVEVSSVRMINYICNAGDALISEPSGFVGIEWTWYGGGFGNGDTSSVEFWLSSDGQVPQDGVGDLGHKVAGRSFASPNQLRADRASMDSLRGNLARDAVIEIGTQTLGLETGWYWLVPVFDPDGENLKLEAFPSPIRVCQPIDAFSGP